MPEGDGKFLVWWQENKPSWMTASRGWTLHDTVVIAELAREAFRAGESTASSRSKDGTAKPSPSSQLND